MYQQLESLSKSDKAQLELLREMLTNLKRVCVAYSGGVDSSLVAAIAHEQLRNNAIAITGVSPSLAPRLLIEAKRQADWIGIHHQECKTDELSNPAYKNNPPNRCFACKEELHKKLKVIAKNSNDYQMVDGVNFDDLNDYRPGIEAGIKANIISPLAELKIRKNTVRNISKALGFYWWGKASEPCLSSRFPYGEMINADRLNQVAMAEEWLHNYGFSLVRVRSQGLAARIEVPPNQIKDLLINIKRKELVKYFLNLGFTSVSVDLEGLVSGKLNRAIKDSISDTIK